MRERARMHRGKKSTRRRMQRRMGRTGVGRGDDDASIWVIRRTLCSKESVRRSA